jgi:hypothetical protein
MRWKVLMTLVPRVSIFTSPRAPAYLPVPPLTASTTLGAGEIGYVSMLAYLFFIVGALVLVVSLIWTVI